MRPVMLGIGAIMIILLMGAAMTGIRDFRSSEYTELHNVTTAANVTTDSVILTQDLFNDETSNVTISSNITADAPVSSGYTSATNTLAISGLVASQLRQLTVVYRYGQLGDYWAADLGARSWPIFLVLGVIGVIAGAVYAAKGNN